MFNLPRNQEYTGMQNVCPELGARAKMAPNSGRAKIQLT